MSDRTFFVVVGLLSAWMGVSGFALTLQVANGPYERFEHSASVFLSQAQADELAGKTLTEVGRHGRQAVPWALDSSGERLVLSWTMPGITAPGAVRRFVTAEGESLQSRVGDLTVTETENGIIVRNAYLEVTHPKRGGGGFPKDFRFCISGRTDATLHFMDRLYRREGDGAYRGQYMAARDPESSARIVFSSPVRVVIESRTRFVRGGGAAPGNPRAVYRYIYAPFSPAFEVTAAVTREDDEPWNELHFLHVTRNDYHYTSFVTGEPPRNIDMQKPGTPSQAHNGSAWGVMATESHAVGVGGGRVTCWDASDEFYYYVVRDRGSWQSRRKEFAGILYVGPSAADLSWYSRWLNVAEQPLVAVVDDAGDSVPDRLSAATLGGDYVLGNDALVIRFAGADRGYACVGIQNRLAGDERFVFPHDEAPGLWRLTFRTPYGEAVAGETGEPYAEMQLTNADRARLSAGRETVADGTRLRFSWIGLDLGEEADCVDVTATVLVRPGSGPSEWRIEVANRSERFGLWEVSYPLLSTVSPQGTADVMQPRGNWGGTLLKNSRSALNVPYPSAACPVQFMAFNRGQAGLYIAAHDGGARAKTLKISAHQDVSFVTQAEDMGLPGSAVAAPFPFVIAAYRGDWWAAARLYRAWAVRQTWARKGWIADRPDVPDHLRDIGLWWLGGGRSDEVLSMMERAAEACSLPIGLHWYNWHEIPFDHSYPDYFPTKPGFAAVVRTLTARGQVMMPYINGRLWDRDIPSFLETGIQAACKQPDGDVYTEIYGSKRRLSPMCPTTGLWQDTVADICRRLMHECGVNAIYLDQIGAARPRLCFDPAHGHPLGGGRHWVDGYREMLERIKAEAVSMNVALTTENTAEPYMDTIDAYLTWVQRNDTDIPLLPAVYSGYTLYFSSPQDAADTFDAFVMAQGRDFLWGCQLGWNHSWLLSPEHRKKLDYQLRLSRLRLAGKAFMVEGQLLDEVRPTQPLPAVTAVWHRRHRHSATLPAVQGTLWRDRSQRLAVFLVNYDGVHRRVDYRIQPAAYLDAAAGPWLVSRLTDAGIAPWKRVTSAELGGSDLLEPYAARVLVIQRLGGAFVAAARAAASGPDPVLAQCAREFLFSEALGTAGVAIRPPDPLHEVVRGEPLTLTLTLGASDIPRTVELEWPDGARQTVLVQAHERRDLSRLLWPGTGEGEAEDMELTVRLGEHTCAYPVHVRYVPAVDVMAACPTAVRAGESFVMPLTAVNNSKTARAVRVRLDTPVDWRVEPAASCDLGQLAPGESRGLLLKCRVPAAAADSRTTLGVQLVQQACLDEVLVLKSRPRAAAMFFGQQPTIDGELDEWVDAASFTLGPDKPGGIRFEDGYGGGADCAARIRTGWDPGHFYLAVEVTDDEFFQEEAGFQMWRGDCIQLAFRDGPPNEQPGYDGSEFEVGLTLGPEGPLAFQWIPGGKVLDTVRLAVVRREIQTVYEAAIPWEALGIDTMRAGRRVAWSMTVNDNDGKGFRGWLEWTPGICGGKDSSAFGWLEAASAE